MRRHDWASRLYDHIAVNANRRFSWGENDCCLFVARAVDAICDTEHAASLASRYHDEATAQAYIAQSGGIAAAVDTFVGQRKAEGRPKRGDVALIKHNDLEALGICVGSEIAIKTTDGVSYLDRSAVIVYWST